MINHNFYCRVDPTRIDEVGPDRAAAEWLLRCGASVKWKDLEHWEIDYNMLPMDNYGKYKIEQINAKDATIMSIGFPHLSNFHMINFIIINIIFLYFRRINISEKIHS